MSRGAHHGQPDSMVLPSLPHTLCDCELGGAGNQIMLVGAAPLCAEHLMVQWKSELVEIEVFLVVEHVKEENLGS